MANVQIPNLPVATSLSGQEELEIVQGGVSRRTTAQAIADLNPPQGTVTQIDTAGGLSGGPITTTGTIQIAAAGVDNTKLADMPAYTVKGRNAGTLGGPGDITMPQLSTMLSLAPSATIDTTDANNITSGQLSDQRYYTTLSDAIDRMVAPVTPDVGTLLYYDTSGWTALINGAAGQVLRSRGSGVGPEWFTTTGTGTVVQVNTGTGLVGGPITISGTVSIANTGVTAASYGNQSQTLTMSVNAQGQLTTAAAVSIAIDASQITTGTLPVNRGGTGQATYLIGDILYASAPTTLTSLQAGTADYVITSNGPSLPPSYKQVNLATAVTGTLPVANGGTGATTLTGYVKGNGTSAFTASATIPNTDITGLGTMSTQNASSVAITGGTIDGTTVGASTPSTGAFTTLTATTLTGYVKANGASVMTASATIPNTDITGLGTMSVQNAGSVAITGGTATLSSVTLTTGTVSTTPSNATDLVNKAYVDSVAEGLKIKTSCEYATTGNITLSGLGTQAGGDWPTSLTSGMRILVKNQTAQADNGIYAASASGWTRTSDANTWDELVSAFTFVHQGTTQSDTGWVCTIDPGGTLGVTPITWTQFSGAGTYNAGTGLTLTGTTFSITNTGVSATSYGTASSVPTISVNAQGQITSAINTPIAIDASAITTGTLGVDRGGTGASSLTGYLKGNGTSAFTGSATIPNTDITGLGTMSTQNASAVAITGGTIDGTAIGGTTASTGKFSSATITGLTGYVYANGSSALTAATSIPGSAISGDISGNAANVNGIVAISNGGTGNSSASGAFDALAPTTTRGDMIYRGASSNLRLAVGTNNQVLLSNGTDPVWGQVSLSAGVTGTLPAVNGGTGQSTYVVGDILYADTSSTLAKLSASVSGSVLISNGAGTAPSWSSTIPTTAGVSSLSFGTTGLTPSTASTGALTVAGTLVVANGGTGATTLTGYVKGNGTSAMTASATIPNTDITGLGTMSTQNASSVAITGGNIDGTVIGGTTRAAGSFTSVNANSTSTFSADILMTGTGGIEIPAGTTGQRPSPATAGYIRYNTTTAKFEGYGSTWGNLGGGAAISDTPPSNPGAGDLWWNSSDGNLYVYYTDVDGSQWVSTTAGGQGAYLPLTGGTLTGSLDFAGIGRRITGDFSNATIANRLMFQSNTTNGATRVNAIPAGTGSVSEFGLFNNSDPTNAGYAAVRMRSGDMQVTSEINGTGTYLPMTFFTGGSERVRIDTSGNVGIGTSSPLGRFTSERAAASAGWVLAGKSAGVSNESGVYIDGSNNAELAARNGSGTLTVRIGSTGDSYITGGNVGIGTSTPSNALHIERSSGNAILRMKDSSSTSDTYYISDSAGTTISQTGSLPLILKTANVERARITSGGSVLAATTSPALGNSHTFQSVSTSVNDWAFIGRHTASNNAVRCILANCNNFNGDDGYFYIGSRSGGDRYYVLTSGNVLNSNNSYGGISDIRLKENIIDATPKLEKLTQVRVVNYNIKGETHKQLGVIAQELEQIFPGMVEEMPARDADGNELGEKHKSVKYSVFVPMLIKAIQELKAELDATKAEIAALKGAN